MLVALLALILLLGSTSVYNAITDRLVLALRDHLVLCVSTIKLQIHSHA